MVLRKLREMVHIILKALDFHPSSKVTATFSPAYLKVVIGQLKT